MKLLIVEDDYTQIGCYKDRCPVEWDVHFVRSVDDALDEIDTYTFDCVILDHRIVGGLGEDVYKVIRAKDLGIPVISASSLYEGNYPGATRVRKAEVIDYIKRGYKHVEEL